MYDYIISQLISMNIADNPNILLHGSEGISHSDIIETFIAKRFGLSLPLLKRYPVWNGLAYIETNYYIEIDCLHPDFSNVLLELLLTISKHKCIHMERHIIFLRNIEYFHRNNSQSLRVLFERFSHNVLFICSTRHINKIEPPILSRMQLYRVPIVLTQLQLKKREPAIKLELTTKEDIRKCAFKLFQQDISIPDIVKAVATKIPQKWIYDFIQQAAELEHQATLNDPSKLAFYLEMLLHILKGYMTNEI